MDSKNVDKYLQQLQLQRNFAQQVNRKVIGGFTKELGKVLSDVKAMVIHHAR